MSDKGMVVFMRINDRKAPLPWGKALAVVLALLVWQAAAMLLNEDLILVSPLRVLLRLFTIWREAGFWGSVWFSFSRITSGFLIALLIGALLAVLAGRFPLVETLLFPYMVTIKSVPVASFIVLVYVWLSSASISAFICALIVLPTVYTGILSGIKARDPKMTEMAEVFEIPFSKRLRHIILPEIAPYILSSASLAAGLAWKSGVAAEIITIPGGSIGEMIYYANLWLTTVDLYAWTVIVVLCSVAFEKLFVLLLKTVIGRIVRL